METNGETGGETSGETGGETSGETGRRTANRTEMDELVTGHDVSNYGHLNGICKQIETRML